MKNILSDISKKTFDILGKFQYVQEKIQDLGETIKDHEKRIAKLEGAYELNVAKVKNVILEEMLKLPQK